MSNRPVSETLIRSRRATREAAFQAAYAVAVGEQNPGEVLESLHAADRFAPETLLYLDQLVTGMALDAERWDEAFEPYLSDGWPLDRLAMTDRVVLRMACLEFWTMDDIPPKVTISEYVRIAAKFGSAESGRFVNGVLATVLTHSPKAEWSADGRAAWGGDDAESVPQAEYRTAEREEKPDEGVWVLRTEEDADEGDDDDDDEFSDGDDPDLAE